MKKFLQKYTPNNTKIGLGWLGKHLHDPCLWNWNRKSISKAFAVGFFCAFLPIPFQMAVAAVFAVIFSANIVLSMTLVWITNPITMGPIFYFTYKLGCIVLDTRIDPYFSFSWLYLKQALVTGLPALLLGSLIAASIASIIGFSSIQWLYRHRVGKRIKRWKNQQFDA